MSITGKIKTLFSDKNKTEALFPRTKVSAVSDDNGVGLNVLLEQTVPMTRGGTGAESGAQGLRNLFADGNTVLSSYQYGKELPTGAASGQMFFKEATGTIADIGQDVAKALRAVNLLDNSDFKNPVNQRGATSWEVGTTASIESLDRWRLCRCSGSLSTNGLVFKWDGTNGVEGYIQQKISRIAKNGDKFTIAAKINGVVYSAVIAAGESGVSEYVTINNDVKFGLARSEYSETNIVLWVTLLTKNTSGITVEWIACYEGEYTVESLPPYVPKGYGAELLECQRYYWQVNDLFRIRCNQATSSLLDFFISLPVPMRVEPTLVTPSEAYVYSMTSTANSGFTLTIPTVADTATKSGYLMIRATKANHGLTDGWLNIPSGSYFSADL